MDFVVEELSPVRKKITITADAAEVNAALGSALRYFRKDLAMPGFRKGKVPASVVERRFADDMKSRVIEDFLGTQLEQYIEESDIFMLSRPDYEGGGVERGKEFSCTVSFDVMPDFDMPNYIGMEVEQDNPEVSESELDAAIHRLLSNMAEETPVEEPRKPVEGDSVVVDFAGFENDEPIEDVKGENFRVTLGEGQVLADFEAIVLDLMPGEEKEGPVAFPENYGHQGLAGKTIAMKVKLHAVNSRKLPELDEEFAKKMGLDSVEKLREAVADSLRGRKAEAVKGAAQQKLMDALLAQVDFPLPEGMVAMREERILGDARIRMEQQERAALEGKSPEEIEEAKKSLDERIEAMRDDAHKEAETFTKIHLLLMAIARKENIAVTQQEADMQLYSMTMRSGQDFTQIRDAYMRSGLMGELLERIQADKAMDFIYSKAVVTTAEEKAEEPAGE